MVKISVVLPVYNGGMYLAESIQSIIAQTYSNWELIIVNDASTDESSRIIKHFQNTDRRIKVLTNQTNQKLPKSLNLGFGQASGEYFTWTSHDNIYDQNAFKIMADIFNNNPKYGLVFCDMYYINHKGDVINNNSAGSVSKDKNRLLLSNCVGACFMYRRSVADSIGEYDPGMLFVEDYDYWLRISFSYEIKHIAAKPYYYRMHDKSLSSSNKDAVGRQFAALHLKHLEKIVRRLPVSEMPTFYTGLWLIDKNAAELAKKELIKYGLDDNSVKWIEKLENKHAPDERKKYIIFGAGNYGQMAYKSLGPDKVAFFSDNFKTGIDNNSNLKILSFTELKEIWKDYNIIIAADNMKSAKIARQFEENGIGQYHVFIS